MKYHDIQLTGSLSVTGSLSIPNHPNTGSATSLTGSIYHDTTDGIIKVYNGNEWQTVGEQTASAAAGGAAANTDIEYLLIAGGASGGAGSAGSGGGGGAGGYLSSSLSSIESGSSITVTVGGGAAAGGTIFVSGIAGSNSSIASAGGTSFNTVTVTGGGEGGYSTSDTAGDGGSGGGGSTNNGSFGSGGSGTVGQGNDGGDGASLSTAQWAAGGGGGAGAAGETAEGNNNAGEGGNGLASTITGTSTTRAGGGGGGAWASGGGTGGTGGGGTGGSGTNVGTDATANTGGGGGGGGQDRAGGAGGSGVAIFAYPTSSASGIGGVKTTRSDGYMVHTFNSSGTLSLAGAGEYPVANGNVFAPILYSGNGTSAGSTNTITGVGFQPDLVWIKNRDNANSNFLTDSIRGAGNYVLSDTADAEDSTSRFNSFDSDGFTVSTDTALLNNSSYDYVAWCWKAGGAAVSGTGTGGVTNVAVSANTNAGFSIVKYTGSGNTGATITHGLNEAPQLSIIKNLDSGTNWDVSFDGITGGTSLNLDTTTGVFSPSLGYHVAGASTLTLNNGGSGISRVNTNSQEYIAYCFHSVDGYLKIGSYTGNTSTLPSVDLGFKPRFLMIKNSTAIYEWVIVDSIRGGSNELNPNSNVAENATGDPADITFNSDGFTINNTEGATNQNNATIIYLAIA